MRVRNERRNEGLERNEEDRRKVDANLLILIRYMSER